MIAQKRGSEKIKFLIVSVGSLVGQNILDSLEFSEFNRRDLVHITGTNSLSLTANNFRCDKCYKVPQTSSPEYLLKMKEILHDVKPHLILTARDADSSAMKEIMLEDETLPGKLPFGSLDSIFCALDKWQSYLFCKKHNLPFAETFLINPSADLNYLKDFVETVGYPMVAKPQKGFASKGVYFVRNWNEVLHFKDQQGYILQEYLGKAAGLESYFESFSGPRPLFTEVPDVSHQTCHVPISMDGEIGEVFCLKNHHHFGAVMRLQRVKNQELEKLAMKFAKAFVSEGGAGPLSIQFRPDKYGVEKAQEMNLRTTGSTYPRLMMGQDEIGIIVNSLLPAFDFPVYNRPDPGYDTIITKSLYSYSISEGQLFSFDEDGYWES